VTVGDNAAGVSTVGVDYRLQAAGVGRAGGVVPGRSWRMMRWRKKEAGGGVGEARGSRAAKAQRCARTNDVSCSRNDELTKRKVRHYIRLIYHPLNLN
jgi:hypothetical protein